MSESPFIFHKHKNKIMPFQTKHRVDICVFSPGLLRSKYNNVFNWYSHTRRGTRIRASSEHEKQHNRKSIASCYL